MHIDYKMFSWRAWCYCIANTTPFYSNCFDAWVIFRIQMKHELCLRIISSFLQSNWWRCTGSPPQVCAGPLPLPSDFLSLCCAPAGIVSSPAKRRSSTLLCLCGRRAGHGRTWACCSLPSRCHPRGPPCYWCLPQHKNSVPQSILLRKWKSFYK